MSDPIEVAGEVEALDAGAGALLLAYPPGRAAELSDVDAPAAVCLAVRDEGPAFDACLASLAQLEDDPVVVIVVDEGYRDWTYVLAARFAAQNARALVVRRVGSPDLGAALAAAMRIAGDRPILVSGGRQVLTADAVKRLGAALDREPRAVVAEAPGAVLQPGAAVAERAGGVYADGNRAGRAVLAAGPADFHPWPILARPGAVAGWGPSGLDDHRAARWALQLHLLGQGDVVELDEPVAAELPSPPPRPRAAHVRAWARAARQVADPDRPGDALTAGTAAALGRALAAAYAAAGPPGAPALGALTAALEAAGAVRQTIEVEAAGPPGEAAADDMRELLDALGASELARRPARPRGPVAVLRVSDGPGPAVRIARAVPGAEPVPAALDGIDRLWAPDDETKRAWVEAGADAARVAVVPTVVDPGRFAPTGPTVDLGEARATRFLVFADSPVEGWQAALRAYVEAFEPGDPVSLVVSAAGAAGLSEDKAVAAIVALVEGEMGIALDATPDLILRTNPVSADQRAGLYRAVTALIGESGDARGQRLRIEAALAGCPVIGPADLRRAAAASGDLADEARAARAAALERNSTRSVRACPAVEAVLGAPRAARSRKPRGPGAGP